MFTDDSSVTDGSHGQIMLHMSNPNPASSSPAQPDTTGEPTESRVIHALDSCCPALAAPKLASGRITVQPWLTFNCLKVKMVPGYESEKGNCRMWPLWWNSSLKLHFPIILLRQKEKQEWQKKANISLCCFKIELILDAYLPGRCFNSRCTLQPHPRVLVSSSAVQPEESEKFSLDRWTSSLVRTLTAKTSKTTQTRKYVHLESDAAFVRPLCAGTPLGRQAFNLTGESAGERKKK